jgi:hypothetical protein
VEDLPVLVVAGSEDALASVKSAQAMASKLLNSVSSLPHIASLFVERMSFAKGLILHC